MKCHFQRDQSWSNRRLALVCLSAVITLLGGMVPIVPAVGAEASESEGQGKLFFEERIRPFLVENCYECHSSQSDVIAGGVRLDTRAGIRKRGENGSAVVPGKSSKSRLFNVLQDEPSNTAIRDHVVSSKVLEDLRRWVEMGAPDLRHRDDATSGQAEEKKSQGEPWSFEPLEKPAIPEVEDSGWPLTPIDRFVLARLEKEGLTPVREADRSTLLRRLYFDLIGLPPTPSEIDRFVNDRSPGAVERVAAQLLGSPAFGERWARHWLDVVRYADSTGERGRLYEESWRYRDYVIKAFNEDRPYDRFIREQVAGDLMESQSYRQRQQQLKATGYLALSPVTFELQDKVQLEWDMIDDQLDTLGRSVLGMTFGCARCHDHKFDPISIEDYYGMAGIFASTKSLEHGNISDWVENELPVSQQHAKALEAHHQAVAELQEKLDRAESELEALQGGSVEGPTAAEDLKGVVVDDHDAEREGDWQDSTYHPRYVGKGYIHDNQEGKGRRSIRFVADLPKAGEYEVRLSYTPGNSRAPAVPVTIAHGNGKERTRLGQQEEPPIDGLFKAVGRYSFKAGKAWVRIGNEGTDGYYVIADAVQFLPVNEADSPPSDEVLARIKKKKRKVEAFETKMEELKKQAPPSRPHAMGVKEAENPHDVAVRIRGNPHRKGKPVSRGFPSALCGESERSIGDDESGRLQLARWLTRPDHPLTARVLVNRVWHHLLGQGVVRTVDNFGKTGDTPSHPALLDWLAVRFVEEGWSVKWLISEIVSSRVYRLSTRKSPSAQAVDPENRLLWRANRKRLEVEPFRDAMLAVSGELDRAMGGSAVRAGTSDEFGYEYRTLRRSVYVPVFRIELYEMFDLFDFPPPTMVRGKRATTTLPTQALFLMNDPWVMNRARAAAKRLLEEPDLTGGERVKLAYRRALGRLPTAKENEDALRFLEEQQSAANPRRREMARLRAWTQFWQSLFASIDFRYTE